MVPDKLKQRFTDKRVGVSGFAAEDEQRLWDLFSDLGAFARRVSIQSASDTSGFDLIVARASSGSDGVLALLDDSSGPCLIVGPADSMIEITERPRRAASDFLSEPWRPEEISLRSYTLLRSKHKPDETADPEELVGGLVEELDVATPASPEPSEEPDLAIEHASQDESPETAEAAVASGPTEPEALPQSEPDPESPAPVVEPPHATSALGPIVVADDDPNISVLIRTMLEREGLECFVAPDGLAAVKLIEEGTPAAVVLDINMPMLDGWEVLDRIAKLPAESRPAVVMLTASRHESDVVRGLEAGADDFMVKPFNVVELRARLRRLIGR